MIESISGDWVLPVTGAPIRDGYVAWQDGRITEIGVGRGHRHYPGALILPGLVNAHSHLEYATYGGFGDGETFAGWLSTHMTRKRALEADDVLAIARRGALDSLAGGITTVADYSFAGDSARAATELGLRAIVYLEVFGSDPATAETRFRAVHDGLAETDLLRIGISPHAPYTCSREVFEWCASLDIPVGTHLAESAAENDWLVDGTGPLAAFAKILVEPTGQRSVATLGPVLSKRLLCAHCVDLQADEIALLGSRNVPVVHCPRSNGALGCGVAPLHELREAGVRVGLGTDSPASTPSIDLWEEMRSAALAARARARRADALSAADALALATISSAGVLGLEDEVGSLDPGKRADMTVLSVAGSAYDPVDDPVVAAVFAGAPSGILETIVNGQTRYRLGEHAWPEVRNTASAARARMFG